MSGREMRQLGVHTTNDDTIEIIQENSGIDDSVIVIHPDQVPLLIKWLEEAKYEIEHPEPA